MMTALRATEIVLVDARRGDCEPEAASRTRSTARPRCSSAVGAARRSLGYDDGSAPPGHGRTRCGRSPPLAVAISLPDARRLRSLGRRRRACAIYVSLPLRGPSGPDGRDAADGARLALAGSRRRGRRGSCRGHVPRRHRGRRRARPLDAGTGGRERPRRDAGLDRDRLPRRLRVRAPRRASLPITNGAGLLQVSPASSADDLVAPFPGSDQVPARCSRPAPAPSAG